ncbi:alpha/beta hydrolase family protein [Kibdelosporangium persicum]
MALAAGCTSPPQGALPANEPPPTPKPAAAVTSTKFMSQARGREVTVITMAPDGHAAEGLPKCVALHGRGGDATWMPALGVQQALTAAVVAGLPPFAVISVDGGPETYWVDGKPGDDPQKMLLAELGPIQAAFGISMGAFGALRFARSRRDLKAVAAISPALFRDWPTAKSKQVFAGRAHWEANEPLRHIGELAGVPLGVWCGTGDPFVTVAKALANQAKPAKSSFTPGAHDVAYWTGIMPEVVAFVGERISGTA